MFFLAMVWDQLFSGGSRSGLGNLYFGREDCVDLGKHRVVGMPEEPQDLSANALSVTNDCVLEQLGGKQELERLLLAGQEQTMNDVVMTDFVKVNVLQGVLDRALEGVDLRLGGLFGSRGC
jgi:hypothetical protein